MLKFIALLICTTDASYTLRPMPDNAASLTSVATLAQNMKAIAARATTLSTSINLGLRVKPQGPPVEMPPPHSGAISNRRLNVPKVLRAVFAQRPVYWNSGDIASSTDLSQTCSKTPTVTSFDILPTSSTNDLVDLAQSKKGNVKDEDPITITPSPPRPATGCPSGFAECGGDPPCIDIDGWKCCPSGQHSCPKYQVCIYKQGSDGGVQYDCEFTVLPIPDGWAEETGPVGGSSSASSSSGAASTSNITPEGSSETVSSSKPTTTSTTTTSSISGSTTRPSSTSAAQSSAPPESIDGSSDADIATTGDTTATRLGMDTPDASTTVADVAATKYTQILKLWQPSENAGAQLSTFRLFRALPLLQLALAYPVLVRSDSSKQPAPEPLYCLLGKLPCGNSVCYNPATQFCCPEQQNVCEGGERCAEGKKSNGAMVYGCAPAGVTDGLDNRIRTSVGIAAPSATKIPNKAAASGTANGSFVRFPTSAATRPSVPKLLRTLASLAQSGRTASSPSTVLDDCCGGICCSQGEVCVRTSGAPQCWPQAGKRNASPARAPKPESASADSQADELDPHDDLIPLSEKKGGVGGGAHGSGHSSSDSSTRTNGASGGGGKHSGAGPPMVPKLLYTLVLLACFFVAASSHGMSIDKSSGKSDKGDEFLLTRDWLVAGQVAGANRRRAVQVKCRLLAGLLLP